MGLCGALVHIYLCLHLTMKQVDLKELQDAMRDAPEDFKAASFEILEQVTQMQELAFHQLYFSIHRQYPTKEIWARCFTEAASSPHIQELTDSILMAALRGCELE